MKDSIRNEHRFLPTEIPSSLSNKEVLIQAELKKISRGSTQDIHLILLFLYLAMTIRAQCD